MTVGSVLEQVWAIRVKDWHPVSKFVAVGGLFALGFVMLTAKAVVLYIFSHETARGIQRMEETRHRSIFELMREYRSVFAQLLHSKPILAALSLMAVTNIYTTVSTSFWGVLFTTKLGFTNAEISIYAALRSIVMTACFFLLGPSLTNIRRFRAPLWVGFGVFFVSQAMLVYRGVPIDDHTVDGNHLSGMDEQHVACFQLVEGDLDLHAVL